MRFLRYLPRKRGPVQHVGYDVHTVNLPDDRRVVVVQAGRMHEERVVPPAGDGFAFQREVWDHRVEVYVSATGRSVRVWIDGVERT